MSAPNPYEPPRTEGNGASPGSPPKSDAKPFTDKLIVLATFSRTIEAQLLVAHLEQHGIEARLGNELSSVFGATLGGPSSAFWIEVLIRQADAERGLELKKSFAMPQESSIPEWTCQCGEEVDAGFEVCWNCSAEYAE